MDIVPQNKSRLWFIVAVSAILLVGAGLLAYIYSYMPNSGDTTAPYAAVVNKTPKSTVIPKLEVSTVANGLNHPWDIGFLSDSTLVYTLRGGSLNALKNGVVTTIVSPADVYAKGEGGMLGLAVDPLYYDNRYIYTCFDSIKEGLDVRVVRWKVKADLSGVDDRADIVTRIPANPTGRHSGCRIRMDVRGNLWIGTGDSAVGSTPQIPTNLGGKVLRVDRDGKPVAGNLGLPFDPRVFSYGHRNIQGLALYPTPRKGVAGYSIEHGSYQDDEVNALVTGNFGWDPKDPYNEMGVPMTDKQKFLSAVDAVWRSGLPTIAPSGATFLQGKQWLSWNGALAVTVLKDKHLRIMRLNEDGTLKDERVEFKDQFGRLRSAVQGPDGMLYISTDNGNSMDSIIKVSPK